MKRRTFLGLAAGTLASGCGSSPAEMPAGKKILVLGGTNFLGPAVVERAMDRGHDVTLFNRGVTRPHLFEKLEKLRGNRQVSGGDLTALEGSRRWDAVIDVWPEESALVRRTAELLRDRTDYYFFCSSIAVYKDFSRAGINETADTHVDDPGWYGGEKARAEQAVKELFPDRFGVARCHSIFGPRDDGAAFHYWLRRLAHSDEVLAPGSGEDPVQYSDVRDVAGWIIDCVEQNRVGTHNICGSPDTLTFRELLEVSGHAINSRAKIIWVDSGFLREGQGVSSFSDMPLWAPLDEDPGFFQIDVSKAAEAGARFRPLQDTARDAWRWYQSYFFRETTFPMRGLGLSPEREREILTAWRERG